jgi:hypothetical protein
MGIAVIFYLAFYLLLMGLVGTIVLACVPRFRVNVSNVPLFIVGAIVGWVATLLPIERWNRNWRPFPMWVSVGAWAVLVAGLIGGGVGMVALKMKFAEITRKTK